MGVYIKGMEMPKSCWDCYFQDCGNCRLKDHKVVDKCIIEDRIDEDCPLIPVPQHGDLIDRTEAIVDANERAYDFWSSDAEADATVKFLQEQVSIIPAGEEKHELPRL